MKRISLDSVQSCSELLRKNRCLANGKNFRISHLYETAARSRWCYENLWGIYLAKPEFSWMALWIAVISRNRIKKRQVRYFTPDRASGDRIGKISIFNPQGLGKSDILCDEAYLYLFDSREFENFAEITLPGRGDQKEKMGILIDQGFHCEVIRRRGKNYDAWVHASRTQLVVDVDAWQKAIVNVEQLVPCAEVVLTGKLIQALAKRIRWARKEIGEDYIVS